jgi:hypothetical protein
MAIGFLVLDFQYRISREVIEQGEFIMEGVNQGTLVTSL